MRNIVRDLGPTRYSDSQKILVYLLGRPSLFILAIVFGVLLREAGYHILWLLLCFVPTFIIEFRYTPKMKTLIKQQQKLYKFKASSDIEWNIEKYKEYEKIRKAEIKWWEC